MISHWLDYSALQQYSQIAMSALYRRDALLKANHFISNSSPNIIQKRNSSSEMLPPPEFPFFPPPFLPSPLHYCLEDFYFLGSGKSSRWFSDSLKFFLPNCKRKFHLSFLHGLPIEVIFIHDIIFKFSQIINVILLNNVLWHHILF